MREQTKEKRLEMPNGFNGTKEEWDRIEAPLKELDELISAFAREKGIEVDYNYHNRPNRRLIWDSQGMTRAIQVTLQDEDKLTLAVAFFAWRDVNGERYGKWVRVINDLTLPELKNRIESLLAEGYQTLTSFPAEELDFWYTIEPWQS